MKFECLNLSNSIKKALNDMNYIDMTSIQEKTFDIISKGKDVIVTSNTGTGKTLAYLVPLVEKIDINEHSTQILVLVPTRELAIQINNCVENLIKYNNQIEYIFWVPVGRFFFCGKGFGALFFLYFLIPWVFFF